MAGRLIKPLEVAITAATVGGQLTMVSTTGLYERAKAWLSNGGQPSRLVTIVQVVDATHVLVRFDNTGAGGGVGTTPNDLIGYAPNYGYNDVSAYNGGKLDQMDQLVYNPNDAPLT